MSSSVAVDRCGARKSSSLCYKRPRRRTRHSFRPSRRSGRVSSAMVEILAAPPEDLLCLRAPSSYVC